MTGSSISSLQAAESLLALITTSQDRIRAIRHSSQVLASLNREERPEIEVVLETPIPRESPLPPIRAEDADPVPFEEQQTQALDPDMAALLDEDPPEPPIRSQDAPPVRTRDDKPNAPDQEEPDSPDDEEPSIELSADAAETDRSIEGKTDPRAEERAEARARAALELREAQVESEHVQQKLQLEVDKDKDEAYRQARKQGVAAIQISSLSESRAVRDLVAIAEADDVDLEQEAERSSQSSEAGGLKVDVLIPEVEVEIDADLPELTDSAAPFSSLTGLEVKDNPVTGMIAEFLGKARAAEARGDLQEAIVAYGDALDVNGELDIAWLGRGRCRTEIGDFGAALSDLKHAQSISPTSVSPVLEMGHLYYARKAYLQATHYYGEALGIEPNNEMALGRRGLCHHYLDDPEQALRDLRTAMEINPELPNLEQSLQMVENSLEVQH